MKNKYIIVTAINGVDFSCQECETLEKAQKLVEELKKENLYLAKTCGWSSLPEYSIEKVIL